MWVEKERKKEVNERWSEWSRKAKLQRVWWVIYIHIIAAGEPWTGDYDKVSNKEWGREAEWENSGRMVVVRARDKKCFGVFKKCSHRFSSLVQYYTHPFLAEFNILDYRIAVRRCCYIRHLWAHSNTILFQGKTHMLVFAEYMWPTQGKSVTYQGLEFQALSWIAMYFILAKLLKLL